MEILEFNLFNFLNKSKKTTVPHRPHSHLPFSTLKYSISQQGRWKAGK